MQLRRYVSAAMVFFLSSLFVLTACVTSDPAPPTALLQPQARSSAVATSSKAMVTSAHPLASEAGLAMLRAGGNAVDAAVAVSFAIAVVRPQSTGLGGGGFLLHYDPRQQTTVVFDFRERAPLKASEDMFVDAEGRVLDYVHQGVRVPSASVNGHLAVATPGLVAGLLEVHAKLGRLPLAQILEPAIKIAQEGFAVYPALAAEIVKRQEVIKHFQAMRALFMPAGKPLEAGAWLVQTQLARTLRLIAAKGRAGFYQGEVAQKIIAEIKRGGGILSQADLDAYQVLRREPLTALYRGYRIVTMPPPSSGGVHIIEILNMLSGDPIGAWGLHSVRGTHLLAEAMRRAYADRAAYLGDPDFVKVPVRGLSSPQYAAKLRQSIDLTRASLSSQVAAGEPFAYESPSTTHLSVVDREGFAVSSTQTINYTFGSCVLAAGTGVILNDEMDDFAIKPGSPNAFGLLGARANAVAARKTMLSSMSPTLVFDPTGKLKLILGSPGGSRIITATLQTLINVIDHRLPLVDAVNAPRLHQQWYPDEIRIESIGLPAATIAGLRKLGHKVTVYPEAIGDVQAIAWEKGQWTGVADRRSDGKPMGL